jgi:hypothetical protein
MIGAGLKYPTGFGNTHLGFWDGFSRRKELVGFGECIVHVIASREFTILGRMQERDTMVHQWSFEPWLC